MSRVLWHNARLATLDGETPWGWVENGALLTEGDRILWVGEAAQLSPELAASTPRRHDLQGALVTPGLIDCHTHLVYGGQRAHEFELRLQGASYEEIARAGGGIRSSVAATRAASEDQLFKQAAKRAQALMGEGVCTLEVKSGYGLSLIDEAKQLRVARRLGKELALALQPVLEGNAGTEGKDGSTTALAAWFKS